MCPKAALLRRQEPGLCRAQAGFPGEGRCCSEPHRVGKVGPARPDPLPARGPGGFQLLSCWARHTRQQVRV